MIPLISTKVHGILDYLVSVLLIAAPWILGFSIYTGATWIMVMLGIVGIIYSLLTRYELGYLGLISMKTHLRFDAAMGIYLIISPWVMNFSYYTYMPHIIAGSMILVVTVLTKTKATYSPKPVLSPRSSKKPQEKVF